MNAVKEKDSTVMLRIFTMYMQIYGIIASFDVMSSFIYKFVSFMSYGGEPSGKVLYSLDCLFLNYGITKNTLYIMKLGIVSMFPIIGSIFAALIYL